MEKARRSLLLIFTLLMLFNMASTVRATQSEMGPLYLKNGAIIKCNAVWRGLGDYVWCSRSGGIEGYPADEVDLVMTFETQPAVNRLVSESRSNFEKGDWDRAAKKASEALSLYPRSEAAYAIRSEAYGKLGWYYQARADAEAAIKINPGFGLAYNNRGYAHEKMGKLLEAKKDYDTACRLGEGLGCASSERLLGSVITARVAELLDQSLERFQKQDWDGVIDATTKALELDPRSVVAYTNRAGAYANKGLFEKALQDCEESLKINPNFSLTYNNRGYAFEGMGKSQEASQDYNTSCLLGYQRGCENLQRLGQK